MAIQHDDIASKVKFLAIQPLDSKTIYELVR